MKLFTPFYGKHLEYGAEIIDLFGWQMPVVYTSPKEEYRMVRERAGFSYETSTSEPDLKEQILKLRAMKNSPYWNRSFADIAGMILLKYVPKEIQKYEEK